MNNIAQLHAVPNTGISLTPHQQAAYSQIYEFATKDNSSGMMTLEGYAGTGKTTLIGKLVAALIEAYGISIAISAPTNKAVRVLAQKVGDGISSDSIGSIHSFLGLKLVEDSRTPECRREAPPTLHEFGLCIVDEASMLSDQLYSEILTNKGRCKILFVGDPAQLPPVGAQPGCLSPVFSQVQHKATLTRVVRQAEGNPIIKGSMAIRAAIERGERATLHEVQECFPPAPASACVMSGGEQTCIDVALHEINAGRDARVLAFTNATVRQCNAIIHHAIHGITPFPFVVGQSVIAHKPYEDKKAMVSLINSEEAEVVAIEDSTHPYFKHIATAKVTLRKENGNEIDAFIPRNPDQLDTEIDAGWREHSRLKAAECGAASYQDREKARDATEEALKHVLALTHTFAHLRHTYALTTHKSQGSTFDTAIVHLSDLGKMRGDQEFNRALYVAITRPSKYLAVVV